MMLESKNHFLFEEDVFQFIGCEVDVPNMIKQDLLEKPSENTWVVEFGLRVIPFQQQPHFEVIYKAVKVGEYVPDLMVKDQIVVDTKPIKKILDIERGQILNYVKITSLEVGIILKFKSLKFFVESMGRTKLVTKSVSDFHRHSHWDLTMSMEIVGYE